MCSVRMEFRKGKFIDENNKELTNSAENPAGNLINVVVLKSKVFPSTRRVGYYTIKYVTGPDLMSDYIEVGLQVGVILQRGAFYDIINNVEDVIITCISTDGQKNLDSENKFDSTLLYIIKHKDDYNIVDENPNLDLNSQMCIIGKVSLKEQLEQHKEWLDLIDAVVDGKDIEELVDEDTLAKANETVANAEE